MSDYTFYNQLTLDGETLTGKEVIHYCASHDNEMMREVGRFMHDWLLPEPYMELRTSGSTGTPKLIKADKNKMLFSASLTAGYFDLKRGQTALLCLPLEYIAGKMMVVRALFSSLNLLCVPAASRPLGALSEKARIDFAAMIPMQLQESLFDPAILSINKLLLGGGPVSHTLSSRLQSLPLEVYHGYAMTETLSHIALRRVNGPNATEEYSLLPGIKTEIDERGCLVVIAKDLLDEPVVTNDLVEFTGPGRFTWKGRIDNVINSGGIKLIPELIESKLQAILSHRFYLAKLTDEKLGEKMILVVEGDYPAAAEILSLKEKMKQVLNKYEVPKDIYFLRHFIETNSGKINRPLTTQQVISGAHEN